MVILTNPVADFIFQRPIWLLLLTHYTHIVVVRWASSGVRTFSPLSIDGIVTTDPYLNIERNKSSIFCSASALQCTQPGLSRLRLASNCNDVLQFVPDVFLSNRYHILVEKVLSWLSPSAGIGTCSFSVGLCEGRVFRKSTHT